MLKRTHEYREDGGAIAEIVKGTGLVALTEAVERKPNTPDQIATAFIQDMSSHRLKPEEFAVRVITEQTRWPLPNKTDIINVEGWLLPPAKTKPNGERSYQTDRGDTVTVKCSDTMKQFEDDWRFNTARTTKKTLFGNRQIPASAQIVTPHSEFMLLSATSYMRSQAHRRLEASFNPAEAVDADSIEAVTEALLLSGAFYKINR